MKKYMMAGGFAAVLLLGAYGEDEPEVETDPTVGDTIDEETGEEPTGEEGEE